MSAHTSIDTSSGELTVASDDRLAGVYFPGRRTRPAATTFGRQPCPRVGMDGRLVGHAGNLHRKRVLLDLGAATVGSPAVLF